MATYYEITREEMTTCLESKGFEQVTDTSAEELVYQWEHPKMPGYAVRVYTSISDRKGKAREAGADAIRCLYWSTDLGKPIYSTKRIHRVEGWEANLTRRLRVMAGVAAKLKPIQCPECSAPMSARKGKYGKFYGCLCYPDCKGTRKADEVDAYLKKVEEAALKYIKAAKAA